MERNAFDYIIVGGGSAGCVLANRLSARSSNRVLLVEAGPDTPHGKTPPEILDTFPGTVYFDPRYLWNDLKVTTQARPELRDGAPVWPQRKYEQARVMGGGSSINGQLANRGSPADYAKWESRGAAGWGWEKVLPYFCKIERDLDFDGPAHGECGRIPVRRILPELWNEHAKAVGAAFEKIGYPYLPDQNDGFDDGYFALPISNAYERRVSAAIGYLDPMTRKRPNLTISPDSTVTELLFDGVRAIGVRALVCRKPEEFSGNEIILCGGAIHSPALLMRAGIGPAKHLNDLGIVVRRDLPGVGQRLMDHPSVSLSSYVKPFARVNNFTRRHCLVGLRYSSRLSGAPSGDMLIAAATKSAWHAVGKQIGSLIMYVNHTYSEDGAVRLKSPDWRVEPSVDFRLLSDERDLVRLVGAFRKMGGLFALPEIQAVTSDPFPSTYSDKVRSVGVVNRKNQIITSIAANLMDASSGLRRYLIRNVITEGFTFAQVMRDDAAAEAFVRKATIGVWHASCTCRMGDGRDPLAVVNSYGRVHAIYGLRVVDASIFPMVPSANTNFPVMMVAEKIADDILQGR
jgi:5-(hydroxymethyl)furfural/furfural oxidase